MRSPIRVAMPASWAICRCGSASRSMARQSSRSRSGACLSSPTVRTSRSSARIARLVPKTAYTVAAATSAASAIAVMVVAA
jgi:hypothetical protein